MQNSKRKNLILLVAPIITIGWLCLLFITKGIYPFGEHSLLDGDLYHQFITNYYYNYDVFHGYGNPCFDFYTVCGLERNVAFSIFNISDLFLFFFKREMLYKALSFMLIFKFAVISITSTYSFRKIFQRLSPLWIVFLSVLYTFSGYTMQYYQVLDWLDIVALFPLIILFMLYSFNGKSKLPLFISLVILLLNNTYLSWFVLLTLIVFGGLYIFTVVSKDNRKQCIYSLGITTAFSLAGTSYFVAKYLMFISKTSRFSISEVSQDAQGLNKLIEILKMEYAEDIVPLLMLVGTELAITLIVIMLFKGFKDKNSDLKRHSIFFLTSIVLLGIQTAIPATDLLWHGGSHMMFPIRNGFFISFLVCCVIGYYFSKVEDNGIVFKSDVLNILPILLTAFSVLFVYPYARMFYDKLVDYNVLLNNLIQKSMVYPFLMFFFLSIIPYAIIRIIKYKKLKNLLTVLMALTVVFTNSFYLIAGNSEKAKESIKIAIMNTEKVKEYNEEDVLNRVLNPDNNLMPNFAYLCRVGSVVQWNGIATESQVASVGNLGFTTFRTRTYDIGSTAFVQALLHITKRVSETADEELYIKEHDISDTLGLYKNIYSLPLSVVFDDSIVNINADDYENIYEYQNAIYNAMGFEGELFSKNEIDFTTLKSYTIDEYNSEFSQNEESKNISVQSDVRVLTRQTHYQVSGNKMLYGYLENEEKAITKFAVNEVALSNMSTLPSIDNDARCIEIGAFNNENVEIELDTTSEGNDFSIYEMDIERLSQICEYFEGCSNYSLDKSNVGIDLLAKTDGVAFIPISYSENWNCTLNNQEVEPICVLDNYIGIKVQQGENHIELNYPNNDFYKIVIFTVAGVIVAFALMLLERKVKAPKLIYDIMGIAFAVLFVGAISILYLLPIGYKLISLIIG